MAFLQKHPTHGDSSSQKRLPRFEEKAARFFAAEVAQLLPCHIFLCRKKVSRWNGEPLEILHSPLPIGEVPTPFMAPNVAVPKKFFSTETSLIDS